MFAHEMSVLAAIPTLNVASASSESLQPQNNNNAGHVLANVNNHNNIKNKLLPHYPDNHNCSSDINSNYSYLDCNLQSNGNNILSTALAQQYYQNLRLNYKQSLVTVDASFAHDSNSTLKIANLESLLIKTNTNEDTHTHSDNNNNINGNCSIASNTETNSSVASDSLKLDHSTNMHYNSETSNDTMTSSSFSSTHSLYSPPIAHKPPIAPDVKTAYNSEPSSDTNTAGSRDNQKRTTSVGQRNIERQEYNNKRRSDQPTNDQNIESAKQLESKSTAIPPANTQRQANVGGARLEVGAGNNGATGIRNLPRNMNQEDRGRNRPEHKNGYRNWTNNRRNHNSGGSSHSGSAHGYNQRFDSKSRINAETAENIGATASKNVKDKELAANRNQWQGPSKCDNNMTTNTAAKTDTIVTAEAPANNTKPVTDNRMPNVNQNVTEATPATETFTNKQSALPIATAPAAGIATAPLHNEAPAQAGYSNTVHHRYDLKFITELGERLHQTKINTSIYKDGSVASPPVCRNPLDYNANNMVMADNRQCFNGVCNAGSLGPNTQHMQQQYHNIPPFPYHNQSNFPHFPPPAGTVTFGSFNRPMMETLGENMGNRRPIEYAGTMTAGAANCANYPNFFQQQQQPPYSGMQLHYNEQMNGMLVSEPVNSFPNAGNLNNHNQSRFRHYNPNHVNNHNRAGGYHHHQQSRNYSNSNIMLHSGNSSRNQQPNAQANGRANDAEQQQQHNAAANTQTTDATAKTMPKPNLALTDKKSRSSFNAAPGNGNRMQSKYNYQHDHSRRNSQCRNDAAERQSSEHSMQLQEHFSYNHSTGELQATSSMSSTSSEYRQGASSLPMQSRQKCVPMPTQQPQQKWQQQQQQLPPSVMRCSTLDEAATATAVAAAAANVTANPLPTTIEHESDASSTLSNKEQHQSRRRHRCKSFRDSHSSMSSLSSTNSLSGISDNGTRQLANGAAIEQEHGSQQCTYSQQTSETYTQNTTLYSSQSSYHVTSNFPPLPKPGTDKSLGRTPTDAEMISLCRQGVLPSQQILSNATNELSEMPVVYRNGHWTAQVATIANLRMHYDEVAEKFQEASRRRCPSCNYIHKEICPEHCRRDRCYRPHTLAELLMTPTPADRYLARSHLVEMKMPPSGWLTGGIWDGISQSVWDKFNSAQQTEERYKEKMKLWRYLFIIFRNCYPRFGLYLVGSTISGFGSNTSDVDMCVVTRNSSAVDQRYEALCSLKCLRETLGGNSEDFDNFQLIEAKVPILRFRNRSNDLEVDLNFNNSVGIRNTHLLYCYAECDWRVRPLALVVKQWAHFHMINNAKDMTISSYSLVLMVINFLQVLEPIPVLPCLHRMYPDKFQLLRSNDFGNLDMREDLGFKTSNTLPLGELFLLFLKHYDEFEFHKYAVSVRTGGYLPIYICREARSLKNDPHQWSYLCIEEPFDLTNTARSVYDFEAFQHIKAVIKASYKMLDKTRDLNSIFQELPDVPPRIRVPSPRDFEMRRTDKYASRWRCPMMYNEDYAAMKNLRDGLKTDTDANSVSDSNSLATDSVTSSDASQSNDTNADCCSEYLRKLSLQNELMIKEDQKSAMQATPQEAQNADITQSAEDNGASGLEQTLHIENPALAAANGEKDYKSMAERLLMADNDDKVACLQPIKVCNNLNENSEELRQENSNIETATINNENSALCGSESANELPSTSP